VQAGGDRAPALTSGFPATREALYNYDAVFIANVESDFFTRAQLALAADFVSARGGGLLVMGGRSFAQGGLIGTPLEEALPVELNDRRGLMRGSIGEDLVGSQNSVVLTPEGQAHPIMRLGRSPEETRRLWASRPALAASAPLGGPRPGASVLAVTSPASGGLFPLIAVQRYGRGRSMIFAGEASWRWRMMMPSSDRTYELFWRQAARWLSTETPDPVLATTPDAAEPGDLVELTLEARDRAFTPVPDADIEATLTEPGGGTAPVPFRPVAESAGRFVSSTRLGSSGLYHLAARARKGRAILGATDRWFYVGGSDREFADPRLNESFLRRLARESGGEYLPASKASSLDSWLRAAAPQTLQPERRDLWHERWAFAAVIALLSAEWIIRRVLGLR